MRSDAAPFSKIYAELYFDAKRLEKGLNWGVVKFLVPFFSKKVLFWSIMDAVLIF